MTTRSSLKQDNYNYIVTHIMVFMIGILLTILSIKIIGLFDSTIIAKYDLVTQNDTHLQEKINHIQFENEQLLARIETLEDVCNKSNNLNTTSQQYIKDLKKELLECKSKFII